MLCVLHFMCYNPIMANKRDLTKELLAECFKSLLETVPFSKITIKMITDKAGLIRPTFYKHFQDKYEVIEWIFRTDVIDNVQTLIENNMFPEALRMFFRCLEKDKDFYRRAYATKGPNSFKTLIYQTIYKNVLVLINEFAPSDINRDSVLTPEVLADYYSLGLANLIRRWILGEIKCTADELCDAYKLLLSSSVLRILSMED